MKNNARGVCGGTRGCCWYTTLNASVSRLWSSEAVEMCKMMANGFGNRFWQDLFITER